MVSACNVLTLTKVVPVFMLSGPTNTDLILSWELITTDSLIVVCVLSCLY